MMEAFAAIAAIYLATRGGSKVGLAPVQYTPSVVRSGSIEAENIKTVFRRVWFERGLKGPVWVTSETDGVHSKGSLHYEGKAVDFRHGLHWSPQINSQADIEAFCWALATALGDGHDVVLERTHIHVERDSDSAYLVTREYRWPGPPV